MSEMLETPGDILCHLYDYLYNCKASNLLTKHKIIYYRVAFSVIPLVLSGYITISSSNIDYTPV